jgi:hypothetical protein
VYQIGDAYIVKDGNHRVSVAVKRGQHFIDAVVTKIDVPVTIDASTSLEDLIRKKEQAEFLNQTNLHRLCPDLQSPILTVPGGYQKLIEHIQVHRWYLGEQRQTEIAWEEAVASWAEKVYLPLVKEIRHNRILKSFPDRTEADLYLWIIEHLAYLREENQTEISLQDAARHFVASFAGSRLHRFLIKLGLAKSTPETPRPRPAPPRADSDSPSSPSNETSHETE